jgi:hypothetical protein
VSHSRWRQAASRSSQQVEASIRQIFRLRLCASNAIIRAMPTLLVPFSESLKLAEGSIYWSTPLGAATSG